MQFIFLGPPGAGKGTQASLLADRWQIAHVSTGDILRKAISGKTSLGLQAQAHVEAGELVPDVLIMALMREYFGQIDRNQGWILDGFPRTVTQAYALDELLSIVRQPHPRVVFFEVAPEALVERMLARGRQDDTRDTIRRRLEIYQADTAPLVELYQRRKCLVKADGNRPVEAISHYLQHVLAQHQAKALA